MIKPIYALGVLGTILKDDCILLVRTNYAGKKWQLPGGYVEPSEGIEKALYREILEELGVESTILGTVGTYIRQSDHNIVLVFEIRTAEDKFSIQESEISETRYFNVTNLPSEISNRTKIIIHDSLRNLRGQVWTFETLNDPGKLII